MDLEKLFAEIRKVVREEMGTTARPLAVTLSKAAVLLSVHPRTVSRMIKQGELVTVEIHRGLRRVTMSEIDRVLAGPRMKSSGATPERIKYDSDAAMRKLKELRAKSKAKPTKPKKP